MAWLRPTLMVPNRDGLVGYEPRRQSARAAALSTRRRRLDGPCGGVGDNEPCSVTGEHLLFSTVEARDAPLEVDAFGAMWMWAGAPRAATDCRLEAAERACAADIGRCQPI